MSGFCRAIIAFALLCVVTEGWGMPWSTDMYDQPSVKPQERQIQVPEDSVPVNGKTEQIPRDIADKTLKNPISATPESIELGRQRFALTCSPCHGLSAKGEGPVARKFIPPPDLTGDFVQARSDGYIFGTMTNGGAIMPSYRIQLSPEQRWDIVNYIRSLKK